MLAKCPAAAFLQGELKKHGKKKEPSQTSQKASQKPNQTSQEPSQTSQKASQKPNQTSQNQAKPAKKPARSQTRSQTKPARKPARSQKARQKPSQPEANQKASQGFLSGRSPCSHTLSSWAKLRRPLANAKALFHVRLYINRMTIASARKRESSARERGQNTTHHTKTQKNRKQGNPQPWPLTRR